MEFVEVSDDKVGIAIEFGPQKNDICSQVIKIIKRVAFEKRGQDAKVIEV